MTSQHLRYVLWTLLAAALFLNYQAWLHDYGTGPAPSAQERAGGHGPAGKEGASEGFAAPHLGPASAAPASPAAASGESAATSQAAPGEGTPSVGNAPAGAAAPERGPTVRVSTDVLELAISLRGGALVGAKLPHYPLVKGEAAPVELENDASAATLYELRSGLAGPDDAPRPTDSALFTSERASYTLAPGSDELRVPLTWSGPDGVTVTKTFVLRRGEYAIGLEQSVHNASGKGWPAAPYAEIVRNDVPTKRSYFNVSSYAFHGPALWNGIKYQKFTLTDEAERKFTGTVTGGWIAAPQHHFVSAVVPPERDPYQFTLQSQGDEFDLRALGPTQVVAPGATQSFDFKLFVGPKLQSQLEATAPNLDRVADYGRLTMLSKPLFLLLEKVHGLFHNWGVAIILVTFLLKLVFYPLSEASGRSMAKMKALGPRIKQLQETYKDDREKAGRAMMELYRREKVNPVSGCLPMIIQIPVFLAFYYVLIESVEMRQAPFFGWIHDLSSRDPYFILPAIMAGAMFVQYKLNPTPPDPVQAKVFMVMPFAMSLMFAFFPAGLVLYWVTNTILSIAQQWNINRRIEAAAAKKT